MEVNPVDNQCNLKCTYCYENPMRDAGNMSESYNFEAIRAAVAGFDDIRLFGGEPLLAPIEHIEELLSLKKTSTNIQTNGTLLTSEHIELFLRYGATVGISIDGPGEMNDVRSAGTLERTREATKTIEANIVRLCDAGIRTSIIVTLHRLNTASALPRLKEWIAGLFDQGVVSMRLHILEVDSPLVRSKYVLSDTEYLEAYLDLMSFEEQSGKVMFDVATDLRQMLTGQDGRVTCVWAGCDPYNTSAVYGVGADGDLHNCGRTNKAGVNWQKAEDHGWERYMALYNTP